ncbi:unnamed protein product [Nezara viridula]|uniref:Fatty acyl-CoA reductase n=1 Tax=Nezara viridula TaxID=85310 RepID=A0A9P0MHN3_NEZVI|nr:unnamed protein product [Nezara viridula]
MEAIDIYKSFEGESILVTGATGFVGKVLVEKLLRTVPQIRHIYVLIRSKKGQSPEERTAKIFEDPLFSVLDKIEPKWRSKVTTLKGDCTAPELGLSPEDKSLLISEVGVVFHGAATVRFDEELRSAFNINIRGTKELILLAKQMKSLKALIHISTAYTNCHLKIIEEKLYEQPYEYNKLEQMVDNLDPEILQKLLPKILGPWPNTYSFTKAVAEHVINDNSAGLPVAIFRPAIVVGTAYEPLIGWTDNLYGPTGLVVGAGCGVIHSVYGDVNGNANLVPVDMVVSAIIAAASKAIQRGSPPEGSEVPIYNYVSSTDNPLKWSEFKNYIELHGDPVPPIRAVWCYFMTIHRFWIAHLICTMFLHYLPALILDAFGKLTKSDMPSLFNIYKKVDKYSEVISYFSIRSWTFTNENIKALWKSLPDKDKQTFNFDIESLDWNKFFYTYIRGLRVYLLKDEMDTIPKATIRWRRFQMAHRIMKIVFSLLAVQAAWFVIRFSYSLVNA